MSTCTATQISIAVRAPHGVHKSAIRYEPAAAAPPAIPPRSRRRGWAGPTVA